MANNIFNPKDQHKSVSNKVIAGLERISGVFKLLLWEQAKQVGLSPIQIQILVFLAYHKDELCNVSHLAKEFNVTKPTISDAIKVLDQKKLIIKDYSSTDNRSYSILLSDSGKEVVSETEKFADPLKKHIDCYSETEIENLFESISDLIYRLNRAGILNVQRTCFGCRFYQSSSKADYCALLEQPLARQDIRLDCPEFELKH